MARRAVLDPKPPSSLPPSSPLTTATVEVAAVGRGRGGGGGSGGTAVKTVATAGAALCTAPAAAKARESIFRGLPRPLFSVIGSGADPPSTSPWPLGVASAAANAAAAAASLRLAAAAAFFFAAVSSGTMIASAGTAFSACARVRTFAFCCDCVESSGVSSSLSPPLAFVNDEAEEIDDTDRRCDLDIVLQFNKMEWRAPLDASV